MKPLITAILSGSLAIVGGCAGNAPQPASPVMFKSDAEQVGVKTINHTVSAEHLEATAQVSRWTKRVPIRAVTISGDGRVTQLAIRTNFGKELAPGAMLYLSSVTHASDGTVLDIEYAEPSTSCCIMEAIWDEDNQSLTYICIGAERYGLQSRENPDGSTSFWCGEAED